MCCSIDLENKLLKINGDLCFCLGKAPKYTLIHLSRFDSMIKDILNGGNIVKIYQYYKDRLRIDNIKHICPDMVFDWPPLNDNNGGKNSGKIDNSTVQNLDDVVKKVKEAAEKAVEAAKVAKAAKAAKDAKDAEVAKKAAEKEAKAAATDIASVIAPLEKYILF